MKSIVKAAAIFLLIFLATDQTEAKEQAAQCYEWICNRPPVHGPCYASMPRYYYESAIDDCLLFYWGGCWGNMNNFATKIECMWYCHRNRNPPYRCLLNVQYGNYCAYGQYPAKYMWYFDVYESRCKLFYFLGCGGNNNRFDSQYECQTACKPLK